MGFDWPSIHGVIDKVEEELAEVKEAISENNPEHIEEEVGDLLFSIVNLSRFLKLDTENVLHKTIYKFVERLKRWRWRLHLWARISRNAPWKKWMPFGIR